MGHKAHPKIMRIAVLYSWPSRWFSRGKAYAKYLREDVELRKYLFGSFRDAGIAEVEVERGANTVTITVHAARVGVIIGRGGAGLEELRKALVRRFFPQFLPKKGTRGSGGLKLNIVEVTRPALSAPVVLQSMVTDLERRIPFRRVLRQTVERVERAGAQGVKVTVSGRLGGAEIARVEKLGSGKIPLHTLRADIDYAAGMARTTYGAIGVKVWIYRGEIFEEKSKFQNPNDQSNQKSKAFVI